MRFGILVFPGTWSETDCYYQVKDVLGQDAAYVWHDETSLDGFDSVILPGGFSYGDYLRPGAMARFSTVMDALNKFVASGRTAIGICNGFQILCESGLLPGALLPNDHLEYRCQPTQLRTERTDTPFTQACTQGQLLDVPVSHGEGNYFADPATATSSLTPSDLVVWYKPELGVVRSRSQRAGETLETTLAGYDTALAGRAGSQAQGPGGGAGATGGP